MGEEWFKPVWYFQWGLFVFFVWTGSISVADPSLQAVALVVSLGTIAAMIVQGMKALELWNDVRQALQLLAGAVLSLALCLAAASVAAEKPLLQIPFWEAGLAALLYAISWLPFRLFRPIPPRESGQSEGP